MEHQVGAEQERLPTYLPNRAYLCFLGYLIVTGQNSGEYPNHARIYPYPLDVCR